MGNLGILLCALSGLAGLYFLNSALNFVTIPAALSVVDIPVKIVGGILTIIGGIFMLKVGKKKEQYQNK
ncbi:MAG: hypothetical protein Q7S06_00270 [Nanoarchaeota archaeon]|nr:hypothetical protein [Nanoarchaeota archaeon]